MNKRGKKQTQILGPDFRALADLSYLIVLVDLALLIGSNYLTTNALARAITFMQWTCLPSIVILLIREAQRINSQRQTNRESFRYLLLRSVGIGLVMLAGIAGPIYNIPYPVIQDMIAMGGAFFFVFSFPLQWHARRRP